MNFSLWILFVLDYLLLEITTPLIVYHLTSSWRHVQVRIWVSLGCETSLIIMWPLHSQSYCNISMKNGSNVIILEWSSNICRHPVMKFHPPNIRYTFTCKWKTHFPLIYKKLFTTFYFFFRYKKSAEWTSKMSRKSSRYSGGHGSRNTGIFQTKSRGRNRIFKKFGKIGQKYKDTSSSRKTKVRN